MFTYIYDGSFEGLLTAIYDGYYCKNKPEEIVSINEYVPTFLTSPITIETDHEKYKKVYDAIINKISEDSLSNIFYTYLSELKGASTLIYNYVKLGFKYTTKLDLHTYNDTVLKIHKIVNKVSKEEHLMLGFVRFQDLGHNLFYSAIEPDNNILSLIAPHFVKRLSDQNWIIHDMKREMAAVYNCEEWFITALEKDKINTLNSTEIEDRYSSLWKDYFKAATIENRINPKLQKQHVPVRYWKHMNEFNNR